jgi:hypothetical protein
LVIPYGRDQLDTPSHIDLPMPEYNNNLIEEMFKTVISEIRSLSTQITSTQLDHANLRGELTKAILEQGNNFDSKIQTVERRMVEKHDRRKEKVDDLFAGFEDKFTKYQIAFAATFNEYQLAMERKITTVSVKMGIIFSLVTVILGAVIAGLARYILHV